MIHRTRWVLVADLRLDTEMEWAVRNIGDKHHNWPYVGIVIYGVFVSAVVCRVHGEQGVPRTGWQA